MEPGGGQLATETTTLGMVRNVLGHIVPGQKKDIGKDEEFVIAKTDFLLAVFRGFLDNFPADLMHIFVREVCKWAGESLPDSNNPLNLQLSDAQLVRCEDGIGGAYVTFQAVKQSFVLPPLVQTGTSGRIYRPKEERHLVFYMKDINLPSPDKYDTSKIVMFLSQVVLHTGFYDDGLEFIQLGHVQIMSSMAPASTLGHHPLATRLAANLRVCAISYPTHGGTDRGVLANGRCRTHKPEVPKHG
uniref:Uncharacterized protein n=1 Tax=Noctiluca scintillans TaxID=2966 RepID=A0A7S0ZTA1_NOCSC|mmetsp:Transcript_17101/g.46342  ORF Transcript_17101/g.46342 Transcript_17101/m.46342 type:complete len:244 (+) Transcript_17101:1172-1903(+)